MPTFKDDSILIIAPGSHSTLAQLGLPESFTPARHRFKTRMFPAQKAGEWEPHKIRTKHSKPQANGHDPTDMNGAGANGDSEDQVTLEEDTLTDEGAVWPITRGRITNWSCFFALMDYIYHNLNTPFHTAILVLAQPVWTPREHEKITQFFFEKFKTPAFAILDSAHAACYAFGVDTACVIDLGAEKADVTAVVDHLVNDISRGLAVPDCGGEAMTRRLLDLLGPRGFSRDMCEQLKKNPICEVLPANVPLPAAQPTQEASSVSNPAAAASTGAAGSGPDQRMTAGSAGNAPLGPGQDTEMGGDEDKDLEDNEGVLDVASIVTGGKMNEYLERKEKEKQEKQSSKNKKTSESAATTTKPARLKNSERERNTFFYEDHALLDALKGSDMDSNGVAEARHALDEGPQKSSANSASQLTNLGAGDTSSSHNQTQAPRRELSVGTERFLAASGPLMDNLGAAIYRTILAHPQANKRADLWNNLIIVGQGSAVKGFKESLVAALSARFLISPSSATMFTSELPSNFSTPVATGANTPIHPHPHAPATHHSSAVNPLLLAATHAQAPNSSTNYLQTPGQQPHTPNVHREVHSGHGQTPTSVKLAKLPEYFSEWKDIGSEEAAFLGAQVAAKVVFVTDQDPRNKGFMTRTEYNESGPSGIHEFSI